MSTMAKRLTWARESAGYASASEAAEALGLKIPTYVQHENGTRNFPAKRAELYARRLKVNLEWLLTGRGQPRSGALAKKQAVGYVGAGAEVLPMDEHAMGDGLEEVEVPPGMPPDAVLVIVRGDSMYPRYFENERLYYIRRDVDPTELVGRECVVKLEDGRMFVKVLRRGIAEGLFNLESYNGPLIEEKAIEWAAPVLGRVNAGRA